MISSHAGPDIYVVLLSQDILWSKSHPTALQNHELVVSLNEHLLNKCIFFHCLGEKSLSMLGFSAKFFLFFVFDDAHSGV